MPEGLTQDWLYVVETAIKNWLKFDGVNLMTMDYGWAYAGDMWDYAIKAVENTVKQIQLIYQKYWVVEDLSKIKNIIWITPMIGLNDITVENFSLEDAQQLASYVKQNWIWRLSYWSLNRDHPCSLNTVSTKCSSKSNQTKDYEYLYVFKESLEWKQNVYQISDQKIKTTSSENYYKISQNKQINSYEILVPPVYKQKIDKFFDKLVKKYTWEKLEKILTRIILKINDYLRIDKYRNDEKIKAILLFIKNKVDELLK